MDISVELTFSPLQDNYEAPIIAFIQRLRACGLQVLENPLSTQVYGEYHEVMRVLTAEIETAFAGIDIGLMQMKIVKTNRADYVPFF